jgi:hypothetical protein
MTMRKLAASSLILSAAFALPSAAFAQAATMGGPEGEAAAAQQAQAQGPTAAAPATPLNPQVITFVDQQFPIADTNHDGTLTAAEFTAWITGLKTAEQQKAGQVDAAAAQAYAAGALAKADTDKDGTLTKTELVKFFGG